MRRAMKKSMTLLLVIVLCASIAGAAAVIGENRPTSSPITLADQPKKIETPVTINGVTITPGTSPAFRSGDTISFTGPTTLTINGKKVTIGASSGVKILSGGIIEGKTDEGFQAGTFGKSQIPGGVSFRLIKPGYIELGADSEGKKFNVPHIGKFTPSFSGAAKKLTIDADQMPKSVAVGMKGKLTTTMPQGRTVQLENGGLNTVYFSSDPTGDPQISGGSIQKATIIPSDKRKSPQIHTFKDGALFSILPDDTVLLTLGTTTLETKPVASASKDTKTVEVVIDTKQGQEPKLVTSNSDGSTTVKSANPVEGLNALVSLVTGKKAEEAYKEMGQKAVEWATSTFGPSKDSVILWDGSKGGGIIAPANPKEVKVDLTAGNIEANPSAPIMIRSETAAVLTDGPFKANLLEIGLDGGISKTPELGTLLASNQNKPLLKTTDGDVSKSAAPAKIPSAPTPEPVSTSSNDELDTWYNSKTGKARVNNFINALYRLSDRQQAESWELAIQKRDYEQIRTIQKKIGTSTDGKLGGGSLRALNTYTAPDYLASMKAPVTEDDKYEPAPSSRPTTTPTAPVKEPPARERVMPQPDQSQLGRVIAESRQRQIAMINELPSSVLKAAESGGIPISEISTRLGRPTPKIAMEEPTPMEEIESLKFSGILTQEQKRYTKGAYNAQQAEKMKITRSTINPAVARLPTKKLSEAPKNAQAGDALMRPEGRSVFILLKYNRNTGKYISQDNGQSFTPLQVATRDSRIIR